MENLLSGNNNMKYFFDNLNKFFVIAMASVLVRIFAFIIFMFINLENHKGHIVSPLVEQKGIDTAFYQEAAEQYKTYGWSILYKKTEDFYKEPSTEYSGMSPMPLFPLLLILTDYKDGNTIPLALLYLAFCCLLCLIWLRWLKDNGCPTIGLWLFTVIPNPIYFMVAVGTDLPFALLFSVFFVSYFSKNRNNYIWISALILLFLMRPNSLSIGIFVILDQLLRDFNFGKRLNLIILSAMALAVSVIGIFSLPYFVVYLDLSKDFTYFGISNAEYINGIYTNLPTFLDKALSITTFLFAKILYFCGLRPSYSDVSTEVVFLRAFVGIFLLPGLIYILFSKKRSLKMLIFIYMLPIFIGATQDRYHLTIFPILYLYGIQLYAMAMKFIRERIQYRFNGV